MSCQLPNYSAVPTVVPHRKQATCIYFVHTNLYGQLFILQHRHKRLLPWAIMYLAAGGCHAAVAQIQPVGYPVPWYHCATTNDHTYYNYALHAAESQMSQHLNKLRYTFYTPSMLKFCPPLVSQQLSQRSTSV